MTMIIKNVKTKEILSFEEFKKKNLSLVESFLKEESLIKYLKSGKTDFEIVCFKNYDYVKNISSNKIYLIGKDLTLNHVNANANQYVLASNQEIAENYCLVCSSNRNITYNKKNVYYNGNIVLVGAEIMKSYIDKIRNFGSDLPKISGRNLSLEQNTLFFNIGCQKISYNDVLKIINYQSY